MSHALALTTQAPHRAASWLHSRMRRSTMLGLMFVLALVHPLVHGTPIDGGLWDGFLAWVNGQAIADTDD